MPRAVESAVAVIDAARPDSLASPTPCTEYDVRALINHLAGTTAWLQRIGTRTAPDPDDPFGANQDVPTGDWRALLVERVRAVGSAWAGPEAWEGFIEDVQMPASVIGEMAFVELLIHGWDLAMATDQQIGVDDEMARAACRHLAETAELGRQMGAYGPPVEVAPDAPPFDRALGLTGRDPAWKH